MSEAPSLKAPTSEWLSWAKAQHAAYETDPARLEQWMRELEITIANLPTGESWEPPVAPTMMERFAGLKVGITRAHRIKKAVFDALGIVVDAPHDAVAALEEADECPQCGETIQHEGEYGAGGCPGCGWSTEGEALGVVEGRAAPKKSRYDAELYFRQAFAQYCGLFEFSGRRAELAYTVLKEELLPRLRKLPRAVQGSPQALRDTLQQWKEPAFYPYVYHIAALLQPETRRVLLLTDAQKMAVLALHRAYKTVFDGIPERLNTIPIPFLVRKFLLMIGEEAQVDKLPLPKTRAKEVQQEKVWYRLERGLHLPPANAHTALANDLLSGKVAPSDARAILYS